MRGLHGSRQFVIYLLAVGTFAALANDALASDYSGRWSGRWYAAGSAQRRPHEGTLNVHLKPRQDGSYDGTFYGRFALVIPYVYKAQVHPAGNVLRSSKRLGPFGQYQLTLVPQSSGTRNQGFVGSWQTNNAQGTVRLSRRSLWTRTR